MLCSLHGQNKVKYNYIYYSILFFLKTTIFVSFGTTSVLPVVELDEKIIFSKQKQKKTEPKLVAMVALFTASIIHKKQKH